VRGPLSRGQHINCPTCWESKPGQDIYTRNQRGVAISESKRASREWREEHPLAKWDIEWHREAVLPGLEGVPLSAIVAACGVAKSTASAIRSGKSVPAERHWQSLKLLGAVG